VPPTDPWSTQDPPAPRRPGWGCLVAAIIGGIGAIIAVAFAARLIGTALSGVTIR
jgi:branched-subunit amino acid ABC-type transport system permease component